MAENPSRSNRRTPAWKVTLWVVLATGLLGAVTDALTGANQLAKAWGELHDTLVSVFGPEPRVVVTPFEKVGPYASVGCEESRDTTVSYEVPVDAYEVQSSCEWVETHNLKAQPCSTKVSGQVVMASGSAVGRDRELLDCPGGGHGRLKLSGSFKQKVR